MRRFKAVWVALLFALLLVPFGPKADAAGVVGNITTVAAGATGGVSFLTPTYVAPGPAGSVYVSDSDNNRICKIAAGTLEVTVVAGSTTSGFAGDGGPAVDATLSGPTGIAVDASGNVYFADTGNNRIRKISAATGVITTVAGNGSAGFSGDNGPAVDAALNTPYGIAVDAVGTVYLADLDNHRVRKIDPSGVITTVAGDGTMGWSGDGPATAASLNRPMAVALDAFGNLYVADSYNFRLRKIDTAGTITTVAGDGTAAVFGDGGAAAAASIDLPMGVALDDAGNIYLTDGANNLVRKIASDTGIITTVVGTGVAGYSGDDGPAAAATLYGPTGLGFAAGNLYIADTYNNAVRKVQMVAPAGPVRLSTPALAVPTRSITGDVTISWGSVDGFADYTLEVSTDGGASYSVLYSGRNTSLALTGLADGTYLYRIHASAFEYLDSSYRYASLTVLHVCPPPSFLTVAGLSLTGNFTVSWGASSVASPTYLLEVSGDGGLTYSTLYAGSNTSFAVSGLGNGSYLYRVKTTSAGYADSGYRTAYVTVALTCSAPASLLVPPSSVTGDFTISWGTTNVAGALYVLEVSSDGGASFSNVYTGPATSAAISGLSDGSYRYRVKATAAGYADSGYRSATTTVYHVCKTPTLTVAATNATGTISIAWGITNVAGALYVLDVSSDGGTSFSNVYTGTGTGTVFSGLENGSYIYRIKATATGYADSPYRSATVTVNLLCTVPSYLRVPASSSTGGFPVSWGKTNIAGATYQLDVSADGGANFTNVYTGTNPAANVSGLANGSYLYRVKATASGYADSGYQTSAPVTVALACAAPGYLVAPASSTTGSFPVSWGKSNVAGATYRLEVSSDAGASFTGVYTGTNPAATVTGLATGSYLFRVKATYLGYADSAYRASGTVAVVLTCGTPAALAVPAGSITGNFTVSWGASNVSGATYVLEQSGDAGASFTTIYTGTGTSFPVAGLGNGSYLYRVKASATGYADSAYRTSGAVSVLLSCSVPSFLTVSRTNTTGSFPISWGATNVAGATYALEVSTDGGASFATVYTGTGTGTSVTGMTDGSYLYRVKAAAAGYADSGYRNAAAVTVVLTCAAPGQISVPAASSTGDYTVSWGASSTSGVTYLLQVSSDGGASYSPVYTGSATSFAVSGNADGSYRYQVKATKAGLADSGARTSITVTVAHPLI